MKSRFKIYHLLLLLVTFSCGKDNCLKSTGEIVQQERILPSFSKLHFADNVNIILATDSVQKVVVESGEHIIDGIKTELIGDRVYISNTNECNWLRSYKKPLNVYVTLPSLQHIINEGNGNITSNGVLMLQNFNFHHYGNGNVNIQVNASYLWMDLDHYGDYTVTGYTTTGQTNMENVGHFFGAGLKTKVFILNNYNAGQAYIECDSLLTATIEGAGNVYYTGTAQVDLTNTGSGKLIKQ